MYEVRVERTFDASHCRGPGGQKTDVHEHRWSIALRVESERLNHMAIVVDFRRVRDVMDEIIAPIRGTTLEEHPDFAATPTTPLAVAAWMARRISGELSQAPCRLVAVEVEADSGVIYEYRPDLAQGATLP